MTKILNAQTLTKDHLSNLAEVSEEMRVDITTISNRKEQINNSIPLLIEKASKDLPLQKSPNFKSTPKAGLTNPNNLCFLNSILQLISHCTPLSQIIYQLGLKYPKNIYENLSNASEVIRSSEKVLPKEFTIGVYMNLQESITIHGNKIENFEQEDACALLLHLLSNDEYSLENSPLSLIEVAENKKLLSSFEIPFDPTASIFTNTLLRPLDLIINQEHKNLSASMIIQSLLVEKRKDQIGNFFEGEELKTKIYNASITKEVKSTSLPAVLAFKNNLKTSVNLPLKLDSFGTLNEYEFMGAIVHKGSVKTKGSDSKIYAQSTSGHYCALVKNDRDFYFLNDKKVSKISEKKVLKEIGIAPLVLYRKHSAQNNT